MRHWTHRYLGRPYVEGEWDCARLVEAVQREQFGREITLPKAAAGIRARDGQVAAGIPEFGTPVERSLWAEGCGVLMRGAHRTHAVGHHIGVLAFLEFDEHVLHCMAGSGTFLHAVQDLERYGLEISGVYKWLV